MNYNPLPFKTSFIAQGSSTQLGHELSSKPTAALSVRASETVDDYCGGITRNVVRRIPFIY